MPDHIEEMLPVGFSELDAIAASPVSGVELLPPPPTASDSLTSSSAESSLLDIGPLGSTNPSGGSTLPELLDRQDDVTTFDLERGFWRIDQGARELLKYANIYQEHKNSMRSTYGDKKCNTAHLIPKEIDIESMTQLSWGVMRAVADIGAYDRRMHILSGRQQSRSVSPPPDHFRSQDPQRRVSKRKKKDRKERQQEREEESDSEPHAPTQYNTCKSCGTVQSPQWRYGPEGLLNLCNVCGLLHAKKTQRRKTKLDRERRSNTGAPAGV
ncbi:hypothetical protein QBC37DRAFT_378579 [Rhypophila decipiens]|uniref:GATA-type domain-containing protein n=1 Tax=Rhypophila decipiens TaxID=261697 RepID=A0AAN7B5K7_9PEZI|nr:hypothetical protein QBC37DRAFT_378579 [Rhypophila decipiens]